MPFKGEPKQVPKFLFSPRNPLTRFFFMSGLRADESPVEDPLPRPPPPFLAECRRKTSSSSSENISSISIESRLSVESCGISLTLSILIWRVCCWCFLFPFQRSPLVVEYAIQALRLQDLPETAHPWSRGFYDGSSRLLSLNVYQFQGSSAAT